MFALNTEHKKDGVKKKLKREGRGEVIVIANEGGGEGGDTLLLPYRKKGREGEYREISSVCSFVH